VTISSHGASTPVTVRIAPEQLDALEARARKLGVPRSALIRSAIDLLTDEAMLGAFVLARLAGKEPVF
jgi:predicted DNA binding CopG/RHH family protein